MATTISSYSVGLSLDAQNYIKNSALGRAETAKLVREINAARTPADNYARSINLVDKALKAGAIQQSTYNRLVDAAEHKLKAATTTTSNYAAAIGRMAAAYLSFTSIKSGITAATKLSMEAEDASIAFEVLTGSVEESQEMLAELRSLAERTPLTFSNTQAAARTLLSFNVEASQIVGTLKVLGDVVGGNNERFKMISLAFAQMSSAGRLMGQDLLQMINAGFNPLQEISRKTGESMADLKKRMEEGGISADEVTAAFKSATEEGGRFFGMTERLSETTSGKLNIALSELQKVAIELGDAFAPLIGYLAELAAYTMQTDIKPWVEDLKQGLSVLTNISNLNFGEVGELLSGASFKDLDDRMAAIERSKAFQAEQKRLRAAGLPTMETKYSQHAAGKAAAEQRRQADTTGISGAIGSALSSGMESLRNGAGGMMDMIAAVQQGSAMVAMSGVANTQELITSLKDDPAIASLEVGTQEAYAYLTQASRDAEAQARKDAENQKILEENAKKQRDKMNEYLDRINQAMQDNGFKRFR